MSVPEKALKMERVVYICLIVAALFMGIFSNVQSIAAFINCSEEGIDVGTMAVGRHKYYGFHDPVIISPNQVVYPPLQVKDPEYQIPWGTSHFRCFFKEREVALKFEVRKAWITYEFVNETGVIPVQARVQA